MKFSHPLSGRPMPRMPEFPGCAPCLDAIEGVSAHAQPVQGVRPLYWWARELRRRGDVLTDLRFDPITKVATVIVRLASYRVVTIVVTHDGKPAVPQNLPTVIAQGVWRLGVLGWTDELRAVTELLHRLHLIAALPPIVRCTRPIPGLVEQPDRAVRVAYWWAATLKAHGWTLSQCGGDVAGGGFVAEIPNADGDTDVVIYPGAMADDGTEASALANRLGFTLRQHGQRRLVAQLLDGSAAGQGRVS